jgi:hypothetical protein
LPKVPAGNRKRHIVASSFPDTYTNVPNGKTLQKLEKRTKLQSVEDVEDGKYLDIIFEG